MVDGEPIERFSTFSVQQRHTGEGMAMQVLLFLREVCNLDYLRYRGQNYNDAGNMSGCYKSMQEWISEENKLAIYVPSGAH